MTPEDEEATRELNSEAASVRPAGESRSLLLDLGADGERVSAPTVPGMTQLDEETIARVDLRQDIIDLIEGVMIDAKVDFPAGRDARLRISWDEDGLADAILALFPDATRQAERIAELESAFDLVAHLKRQRAFSEKTFGPGARTAGVVDHIRKELKEIEADPSDIMEWVDVVILAFDGAWRAGWEAEKIVEAIVAKQTKNEGRVWPDWRTAPVDKAIEHDRSQDAALATAQTGTATTGAGHA
jgi:hypothetical protein